MKLRHWAQAGLATGTLLLAGCTVNVQHPGPAPAPVPAPPHVAHSSSSTIKEIHAAAGLDFESSRLSALNGIAQRRGLSPREQVHLVDAIYQRMDFESSKRQLLLALIANPDFCNSGKSAILDGLNCNLDFESTKAEVLRSLQERGTLQG